MKQRLLILAAATAVAFAACNGGNNEGSYSQAQVDSIAKVKEDSIAAAMKLQTDSTIAAAAQRTNDSLRVADSIANATTKGASATNVKKNSKPSKPAPPKEEPKEEPKKEVTNADRKAARFGDKEAQQKVEDDSKNKKGDRFKNR